jgi:signal transduction histidine kinase/CheY-like chemotaxis protein
VEAHTQLTPPPAAAGAPATAGDKPGAAPGRSPALPVGAVRTLFRQTPVALFGNVVGMLLIGFVYGDVAEPWRLMAWYVPTLVLWLLRLAQWLLVGRRADADDTTVLRQRGLLATLALAQGAMWGVAAWLFWGVGGTFEKITLLLMLSTYSLGSVQILATQQLLFLPFVSLVFLPAVVRVALDTTQPDHLALATVMLLLFAATVLMGHTYRGALADAVALRLRTEELAAQLAVQKERAEQARAVAETANRAKTQFFAAASHDLRQPLHAMGLFAEALRQRSHDPQVLPLVHSINESVDALESLFAELLDITRIDSGGVDVQPQPVPMRDVFARLRLHFEPIAFEKGLQLEFRGGTHVAFTDAVVLERMLRNLVSNAIRYTHDGGVLVSCRMRRAGLLLQVWDSGIGIAPEHLPRVFDEFYQVQRSAIDAGQRKGLGLGLAIVQRLARLLATQVQVRSRVGHGTVFSFVVPAGQPLRSFDAEVTAAAKVSATPSLNGRCIVVVEDDPSVREGLVVLLQGWGARVQAFDGMQSVQAWLAAPVFAPPDLLIVDYRLPGEATGLDVLATVRAACGARRVPAIVVSGSTMGGLESQAADRDYHLLVKPVLPNKLRAMVSFKLGVR